MNTLETGNLTPPTNTTIINRHYVGGFGQPKGFSDLLEIKIVESGTLYLKIKSQIEYGGEKAESMSITLTNEQRADLAQQLAKHNPIKMEDIVDPHNPPNEDKMITNPDSLASPVKW